jgi:hypothetical protein
LKNEGDRKKGQCTKNNEFEEAVAADMHKYYWVVRNKASVFLIWKVFIWREPLVFLKS